ncbi:S8/S53 family peptidase [Ulvibacter litoralis]|uniref:Por secretion system C-terminal sorting domain-containing protein n=1 Tax=Ulvibacter litoralis TaxID=227084 RepID=A0A1G7D5T4_9FLAO|nr:S8/S53 family peptidase [Ulvibacter litoralis]GHC44759.1 hypothetical protein GCM10008083_04210 [Ulvibacter litoralis]SDE46863.1 Por secretion system C-terminal sorting domain-containing protein [Ulvibacter litoralis]
MKKTTFYNSMKRKSVLFFAMTFIFSMSFAQNSYTIKFQDETIDIPENISTFQWSQMPESSKLEEGYYGWVQFYETPTQDIQNAFKSRNLELINYIPQKTYLFYFPETTSVSFLAQSGVRGIIGVPGTVKLSTALQNPPYEDYAIDGSNILVTLQHYKNVNTQYVINELAAKQISVVEQYDNSNNLLLSIPNNCLTDLSNLPFVKWVELITAPSIKDDTRGRSLHRSSNLDTQTTAGRNYTGEGIGVLVRDDGRVGPHIDFEGRLTNLTGVTGQSHGDGVAGIMSGAGNLNPDNRGMAAGATTYAVNYIASFLDSLTLGLINDGDVQITNSSYSNGCNDGYTTVTQTVDTQTKDIPTLLHVFSAGNSNGSNCGYGAGSQWGNITGGHKQGKNVIATANVFFDGSLVTSSSRGPAHDGRIKPDISANGQNQISTNENNTYQTFGGTSGAAPGIAGVSAQLYQAYGELNGGDFPQSALIKATLMNTANEAGNIGPDYKFGYGIVNGLRAAQLIEDGRYLSDDISQGEANTHTINVPAGTTQVRFMTYWSDTPAAPSANPALVNDLDMVVTDPASGAHLPYILDPTPNATTLDLPATNGVDRLNNVEQVVINNPAAGAYDVDISGFNVPFGPQEYFIVYEIITENLTLTYPNGGESFTPFGAQSLHWDAINTTEDFDLEYSTDNGTTWSAITTVAGTVTNYAWSVPNEVGSQVKVRITSGAFQDESDDVFHIARYPAVLQYDMVCPTEATVSWNAIDDAESYDVYTLGEKYMEVITTTTTEEAIIPITDVNEPIWFAVVAKNATEGWASRRSIAKLHAGGLLNCNLGLEESVLSEGIVLYPNPASDQVMVSTKNNAFETLNVSIINSLGQKLFTNTFTNVSGTNPIAVDVSSYATGMYFMTIESDGVATTKKLVVQ